MPALEGPPARQRRVLHSYDLLVIGGGINGIGVASDSAGRGLSVLAVEMGDLGAATSWTSSKLILPEMRGDWTQDAILPGIDFGGRSREEARTALVERDRGLPEALPRGVFRRHGAHATEVFGEARSAADLGEDFGAGPSEREVSIFVERGRARTAQDVLWRRSKCGLRLDARARDRVAAFLGR